MRTMHASVVCMPPSSSVFPPLSERTSPWQMGFTGDGIAPMADGIGPDMGNMEEEPFLVMTERDSDMPLAFLAYMPGHVHPEETDGKTVDYASEICTRHADDRGPGINTIYFRKRREGHSTIQATRTTRFLCPWLRLPCDGNPRPLSPVVRKEPYRILIEQLVGDFVSESFCELVEQEPLTGAVGEPCRDVGPVSVGSQRDDVLPA